MHSNNITQVNKLNCVLRT